MYGYVKWPPWMVGYTWVVYHLVSQSTWTNTTKGYVSWHYQKGNDTSTTGPHDYSILYDILYIYIIWYMFPHILSLNKNKHVRRTFTNPVRSVLSLGPRLFLRHLPTVALHIRMGTDQHGTAPRKWAGHCLGGIYGNLVGVHGEWR